MYYDRKQVLKSFQEHFHASGKDPNLHQANNCIGRQLSLMTTVDVSTLNLFDYKSIDSEYLKELNAYDMELYSFIQNELSSF